MTDIAGGGVAVLRFEGGPVRFNVLGPWDIRVGDRPVAIPRGQLRTFLASLLLSTEEPVSVDTLAARAWPERVPAQARATLHTYANRLRKLLGPDLIETTRGGGYRLTSPADAVDVHRFRGLLVEARITSSLEQELGVLRSALRLWRGRPFGDESSTWLDHEVVPKLTEEWFGATERRIDLELALGQAGQLVAELRELTERYPTRESLWSRLITALHRAGRRAEALDAYQQVRDILDDELGIDPSAQLNQLQQVVLLDGAETPRRPTGPTGPAVARLRPPGPRQLPHDIAHFVGRGNELAELDRLLAVTGADDLVPAIMSIDGAPGTGKTTLAVHWAHRVAERYPDVQLYLNLRGYGPGEPVPPEVAAETMLRSLGVRNDAIPPGIEERSTLLRSTLAGRRALIVLDNARDANQVRDLLPGTRGLVVVTSRNQLRGLSVRHGAHRVTLSRLSEQQALDVLAAAMGWERVAAEPEAAAQLVRLCDHLPLALAIVAERAQRSERLAEVVAALADQAARLDLLGTGEDDPHTDLRAALSWSYGALTADAATMLRGLGLQPANDIGLAAAAALVDQPIGAAKESLDHLVAAHLVQERRPNRYELHDLIRLYAVDQANRTESVAERDAAVRRMLDWYLHAAVSADRAQSRDRRRDYVRPYQPQTLPPVFASPAAAMTWFEEEYGTLREVVRWAGSHGWAGHAWRTAMALPNFFDSRIPWRDGLEFFQMAFRTAEIAGDVTGEAYTLNSIGCIHVDKADRAQAKAYFRRSLERFMRVGDRRGEAMLRGNLALAHAEAGEYQEALRYGRAAVELCERLDYPRGMAISLDNIGVAYSVIGDYAQAIECFEKAHATYPTLLGTLEGAWSFRNLAAAYAGVRNYRGAVRAYRQAIRIFARIENLRWEMISRIDLGKVIDRAGHPILAREILTAALVTLSDLGDPAAETIRADIDAMTSAP